MAENSSAVNASENHCTGEILGPGFHAVERRDGAEFLQFVDAEEFVLRGRFIRHFANVNRDIDNDHAAGLWLEAKLKEQCGYDVVPSGQQGRLRSLWL